MVLERNTVRGTNVLNFRVLDKPIISSCRVMILLPRAHLTRDKDAPPLRVGSISRRHKRGKSHFLRV
ncbi:hypothetical protein ACET3Z_022845 [Daucus carota]